MPYQILSFQKTNKVMMISITRPSGPAGKVHLSDELNEVCAEISHDEETRVIVLTGADEKAFVIETGLSGETPGEYDEPQTGLGPSVVDPVARLDCPVIAAMKGDAISQGLELALACDIRIASETAHFGLPQVKSERMPWDGGTQRLSRLVGRGRALEMILTGETIEAQEALRIGLVNKIVPPDKVITVAMDLAKEMASKGPIALRYAKEAISKGMDMTLEQGLRLEADLYLLIHTTKDRTEGIKAFQEKRSPKFEGR